MAEILYLVEELLFRMNALLGTSGLPDKLHSFNSDSSDSARLQEGDDGISSGSLDSEVRVEEVGVSVCVWFCFSFFFFYTWGVFHETVLERY